MYGSAWGVFLAAVLVMIAAGQQEKLAGSVCGATSSVSTKKTKDITLGKIVKIGSTKFVKIADDSWMMTEPGEGCNDQVLASAGASKSFSYTGKYQVYTFHLGCQYKVELWGASGGLGLNQGRAVSTQGLGSYVAGNIIAGSNIPVYLYLGQVGYTGVAYKITSSAWNGGGYGDHDHVDNESSGSGGGATDLRTVVTSSQTTWKDTSSLLSRIAVAGGGGGGGYYKGTNHAGGLSGYYTSACSFVGETNQTTGYAFGEGGYRNEGIAGTFGIGGGGGGWYGGTTTTRALASQYLDGWTAGCDAGTGGSSYISGHTGCVAVASLSDTTPKSGCTTGTTDNSCSLSPTGLSFTDTVMIDGAGYSWTNVKGALRQMPNPSGGYYASGVGHTGNGAARITRLN